MLSAAFFASILLAPATAYSSPSPSPSLDGVLKAPLSSGYLEMNAGPGVLEGPVMASDIASSPKDMNALDRDGFLTGFGRTWIDQSNKREMAELVMAFSGGAGAKKWMKASEQTDKADRSYAHPISINGIAFYYGVHLVNPSQPSFIDVVGFVKGNDFFAVGFGSETDDHGASIATQAKGQYDFAPSQTIPPSQWPENASTLADRIGGAAGAAFLYAVVVALLAGMVLLVVGLIRRRQGRPVMLGLADAGSVQMSPDGYYWWDGQGWKDASAEVPPGAQRSKNGCYWWDGRVWRQAPQPPRHPTA
jgi:hypothetical protein